MRSFVRGWLHQPLTLTEEEFVEAADHFGLNRLAAPALRRRVDASLSRAFWRVWIVWAVGVLAGLAIIGLIVQVGWFIPREK